MGCRSVLQIKKYSFKSNPKEDYPFQPGHSCVPVISSQQPLLTNFCSSSSTWYISTTSLPGWKDTNWHKWCPLTSWRQVTAMADPRVNPSSLYPSSRTYWSTTASHTTHQVPMKQWPYNTTPAKQAVIKEQLKEMLTAGIIEPSYSERDLILVTKKDGSLRFCVDYRKLNAITENDAYS